MEIRKPRKKELKVILNALRFYKSLDVISNFDVFVRENDRKEVIFASRDLAEFINQLKNIYFFGIKVGEVGRRFRFSLEGAFWLVKNDKKKVWVNEKGEMLFLYGRDIFKASVLKVGDFDENEIVFVCNKYGDIIGIGKSRFPSNMLKFVDEDRVFVENLVDRGEYIRGNKIYDSY